MKQKRLVNTIFLITLTMSLILTTGCGARSVQLTESDNGKDINVEKGTQLQISLLGNPSTGFSWEVMSVDEVILSLSGEPEFVSDDSKLVGAGGQVILIFDAIKSGSTTLELVYHRSWETNVAPLQTFTIHVTVK